MGWSTAGNLRGPQGVQGPQGTVVDGVTLVDTSFQFTAQGQNVGSPVSFLVLNIDGGSPSGTSDGYIDGGTV
jgi:hypothetical protein